MVALSVVEAANQTLARSGSRPYVAVFTGGTAGIGANAVLGVATAFAKAKATRGLRVYIVGRSEPAAEALIASCRAAYADGDYAFVQASDLSLLADVDRVCAAITTAETAAAQNGGGHAPRIDLLVASQGVLALRARPTAEGLEFGTSLFYYSRMRCVDRLLPLLLSLSGDAGDAGDDNLPGHVVSVFNPKVEGAIVESDLGLHRPENQGVQLRGGQYATFTTLYMEAIVARHPGRIALAHYYPGYVVTDLATNSPLPGWAKLLWRLVAPLLRFLAVPNAECGQRVLFLGSSTYYPAGSGDGSNNSPKTAVVGADGSVASGTYRLDWNDDALPPKKKTAPYRAKGMVDTVYSHTQEVFASVAEHQPG